MTNEPIYQHVVRGFDVKTLISKAIVLAVSIAIIIIISKIPALEKYMLVISIGILFIMSALIRNFSTEYEYTLTDEDFFVDRISGVSKRKSLLSVSLADISEYAAAGSDEFDALSSKAKKLLNFSSSENSENRVCFYSQKDSLAFIIEPEGKMREGLEAVIKNV